MTVLYRDDLAGIREEHLAGFFVGWPNPPSPARHLEILGRSSHVTVALEGPSGKVVGFITAVSDGVLAAYIPLLEVRPDYRGQGIGRTLVERMVARLSHLYMVDLFCDEELVPFYRGLGFARMVAMGQRNYSRQSGS